MLRCVSGGLSAVALLVAVCPAAAADLQAYRPAPPPNAYDWSGIYIGISGGYAYAHALATIAGNSVIISKDDTVSGTLLGGQIGANAQWGPVVLGFEGDLVKTWQGKGYSAGGPSLGLNVENQIPWIATMRGRGGFALDQWLLYGTAGLAVMGVETKGTASFGSNTVSATLFDPQVAFVWGLGLETALWASNVTARIEYLNIRPVDTSNYTGGVDFGTKASNSMLRIGVNARFGGGMK
jgi:outer membrane immunogenic protein